MSANLGLLCVQIHTHTRTFLINYGQITRKENQNLHLLTFVSVSVKPYNGNYCVYRIIWNSRKRRINRNECVGLKAFPLFSANILH